MSDLNRDALGELIQRFAISALSRERKNEAMNEEILAGKYTGEFYIKNKDGAVMSTDIMNRTHSSSNNAIRIAEMVGMTGELYKVEFDDLILPNHIDYSTNILNMEPIQIPNEGNSILLYIDIDEYRIKEDTAVKSVFTNNNIHIVTSCLYTDGTINTIETVSDLHSINYTRIQLDSLKNTEKSIESIFITSVVIDECSATAYDISTNDQFTILHNIFVTIDK